MVPSMSDALNKLWTRFLPEIENRLALLEAAAKASAAGQLSEEQRTASHAAAHKMAGTLGTFGLHRGTDLARQIEHALEDAASVQSAYQSANLAAWTEELRAVIQSRA
jgi:HPt (histidine-containing phosphotransfer) domain-containing protein